MVVADVVQDIEHEGSVARAELVDYEVVEGMVGKFVIGDEIAGNCLAVVGAKELGGGVPKLASLIVGSGVQVILKGGVSFAQLTMEFWFVGNGVEIEGLARGEYGCLFGKVPIVWIVKTV